MKIKHWQPAKFTLAAEHLPESIPFRGHAVLILNQALLNKELLLQICRGALFIVCADGGANCLMDLGLSGREKEICHPDAICGDMDSLLPEVEKHYSSLGTKIHRDSDQYSTDLAKSLKYIDDSSLEISRRWQEKAQAGCPSENLSLDVAIAGGLGGRADQAFSQIHQLYVASEDHSTIFNDLYLVTSESILFLLERGLNFIRCPVGPKLLTKYVGIIPARSPSVITTRGLEWDVTEWLTGFGTQVTTSNHIVNETVEVETSEKVLFTVGISLE